MRICGLDEVGRGALAGPLVGAATIFNSQFTIHNLRDSKKLNPKQRNRLYKKILKCAEVVVETISARQINNRGMGWANREVFRKLIKKIKADRYVVDGPTSPFGKLRATLGVRKRVECMIKADAIVPEVMAASIVAKVTRDKLMKELHKKHPKYGWKTNVGYGTRYHISAIKEFGLVRYHRSVFVTTALRKSNLPLP